MARVKKKNENAIGRILIIAIAILIQLGWLLLLFLKLNRQSIYISAITELLAAVAVLRLYSEDTNSAMRMSWIIAILVFPVMGLALYLLIGRNWRNRAKQRYFRNFQRKSERLLVQQPDLLAQLEREDPSHGNQCRYLLDYGHFPLFRAQEVTFYGDTAAALEAQKAALRGAKRFIFMEYHAIEASAAFEGVREILAEKARQGVEVRILYDEIGSMGFINRKFIGRLEKDGIQCRVFNPIIPLVSIFMNNRDHRKITVVDGVVGFTGGYNLADEYFNLTHPYGEWKDSGIRFSGGAVNSLTLQFLEMWNSIRQADETLSAYLPEAGEPEGCAGYIQPYAENPLFPEPLAENVYLNLVQSARRYIWFVTPYLILSDEMTRALGLAAKRGVDVRIITPGIPDKKLIYQITRSYYAALARQGVRIYEFTPGFCHAKQCVCDGELAVVGTINLDYRSLYHHFENAVLLLHTPAIQSIKEDFDRMLPRCEEVTEKYHSGRSAALRIWQCLLRLIAPLV